MESKEENQSFKENIGLQNQKFEGQMKIAAKSFFERPKTMLEVSEETGILRANLCRYIAKWKKLEIIKIVKFGFCSISLHKAARYSTNPKHWEKIGGENGR